MFKASIALVLVAFAALAYGWIAGNDTILYGSIGASALAGLALLASQRGDRKARPATATDPEREERPDRMSREPKGRAALAGDSPRQRRAGSRLGSADVTRQLDISDDDEEEELERPPAVRKVASPPAGRSRGTRAPKGAAWATEDDLDAELEEEDYGLDQAARDSGFQEESDDEDEEAGEPAARTGQGAAADDFRSRLAAVLGPAEAQEEAAPAPRPKPARARRTAPAPTPEADTPKPRRGRKKAAAPPEIETEGGATEPEPDWVRIDDVPRISRATQPGGGFARPDAPQGLTPYRPRRPAVSPESSGEGAKAPATRRKSTPAEKAGATKPRSTAAKRSTAAGKSPAAGDEAAPKRSTPSKPAVTSVSGTTKPRTRTPKDRDPDAPPPRRGRPPKPKP